MCELGMVGERLWVTLVTRLQFCKEGLELLMTSMDSEVLLELSAGRLKDEGEWEERKLK